MSANNRLLQVAGSAALGGFLFGFDVAVINGAIGSVSGSATGFSLDAWATGLVVSIVSLGAAVGAAAAGAVANRLGRVKVMILAAFLFAISALMSGLSFSLAAIVFWRLIGGLGVGISAVIAPAYIAEITPADKRGRFGTLQQLAIAFGIFGAFITNFLLVKVTGSADAVAWFGLHTWRWMFISELLPAVLYGAFVVFLPESPRYLVAIGHEDEAEKILISVVEETDAGGRVAQIRASLTGDRPRLSDLVDRKYGLRPVVWVALAFAFLIQMAGINNVLLYATDLWTTVGFVGDLSVFIPVLTSIIGIVMTLLGMMVIDRVGRRPLLLWGAIGMFVAMVVSAVTFAQGTLSPEGVLNLSGVWAVISLISVHMVYIVFCGTWGVVLWVFLGEVFPNQIRTAGLGLATAGNWIGGTLVTLLFPVLKEYFGLSGTYFVYAVVGAMLIFLVVRYIPETKGVELEEMSYSTTGRQ
ncbi:sugar porter family MFS transporter [Schaalia vaccimaxillae]|uniref:sugar porter family MFS transporter n=1 Tax=Schaalia vaccimaxillae TaxID=183916 RepID=UPI0003B6E433|nr:sugar porter family MFS transporter [Schaalia vaccimaxillae]